MLAWVDQEDRALAAEYEAFVERRGSFFQSLAWGEVKENWRAQALLSRGEDGGIRAAALALIRPLPLVGGSLLYCPRGPVGEWSDRAVLGDLTEGFARLAERECACLLKLDPLVAPGGPEAALLQSAGFRHRPGEGDYRTLQPRFGYLLPLAGRGEEELLASCSQKCRYKMCIRDSPYTGLLGGRGAGNCWVHWLALLLMAAVAVYTACRRRQTDADAEKMGDERPGLLGKDLFFYSVVSALTALLYLLRGCALDGVALLAVAAAIVASAIVVSRREAEEKSEH